MGRSKRKNKSSARARHSPHDHRVMTNAQAAAAATSGSALPSRVADLLTALNSTALSERQVAAGSIASLAASLVPDTMDETAPMTSGAAGSSASGLAPTQTSRLVTQEAKSLTRPEVLDVLRAKLFEADPNVRLFIAGALRNIAVGSLSGAEALVANDGVAGVMGGIAATFKGLALDGSPADSSEAAVTLWLILAHLLATMQAMAEASASGTLAFTKFGAVGVLSSLLGAAAQGNVPTDIATEAVKCAMTLADNNPAFVAGLTEEAGSDAALVDALSPLLGGAEAVPLLAAMACGLLLAVMTPGTRQPVLASAVPTLTAIVAACDPSADIANDDADAAAAWRTALVASRVALEVLANVCIVDEAAGSTGLDDDIAAALDPPALLAEVILPRLAVLPGNVHDLVASSEFLADRVSAYYGHLTRLIALTTNLWLVLDSEPAAAALDPLWSAASDLVFAVAAHPAGPSRDALEPALSLLTVLAVRAVHDDAVSLSAVSPDQWSSLAELASSLSAPLLRTKATETVALVSGVLDLTSAPDSASALIQFIANQLDDAHIAVVVEAADAVFSLLADPHLNGPLAELAFLDKLAAVQTKLTAAMEAALADGSMEEDLLMRIDEVVENLPRFIEFKNQQQQ